ncbi:MAG: dTDP-4-dehydrorhamnose 3,5-epimerase [Omnitrophica bacterium RIFCSPHIGHO2_02_FULL_63_14]|nr:MAG: dTDP-4-dehydrorhamnose 3,5-epimerase [Omnitrophica bacterium RIFCSPHIGHO2_02_FULL_63_14]
MKFIPAALAGVLVIEPRVFRDERGLFFEQYRRDEFQANGVTADFVQDNYSVSAKGVLRGLHYQVAPRAQSKLVSVLRGSAFDVVVDVRPASQTFGKAFTTVLSAADRKMLFIPEGFAHGFLSLEDDTEFIYKCSDVYSPEHERGIRWDDPALGIPWPKIGIEYILSPKDRMHPLLKDLHGPR